MLPNLYLVRGWEEWWRGERAGIIGIQGHLMASLESRRWMMRPLADGCTKTFLYTLYRLCIFDSLHTNERGEECKGDGSEEGGEVRKISTRNRAMGKEEERANGKSADNKIKQARTFPFKGSPFPISCYTGD